MIYRILLLALPIIWAETVFSQACCTATGSHEFAVVGRCQQGVLASQLSFERAVGSHDREGQFHVLGRGHVQDVVMHVGGGMRIFDPRLQVSGSLPLRLQQRNFGSNHEAQAIGVGDAVLSLRYTALQDSMLGWKSASPPFLDLIVMSTLPTGRAPHQGQEGQLGADVMGEGLLSLGAGARMVSFVTSAHAFFGAATYQWRGLPIGSRERPAGDALNLSLGYLYLFNLHWSASLYGNLRHVFHDDSLSVENVGMTRLRSGASLSYVIVVPIWEISASVTTDPLFNGGGRNIPYAGVNGAIVLKRSFL